MADNFEVTVYYFDGSGGCDACQGITGYYPEEEPDPPHPFCTCSIEEFAVPLEPEWRDVKFDTTEIEQQIKPKLETPCLTEDLPAEPETDDLGEREADVEGELLEAAIEEGYEEPEVDDTSERYTLSKGSVCTVRSMKTVHVAYFEGVRWYVAELPDGEEYERKDGFYSGTLEKTIACYLDVDCHPCGEEPERPWPVMPERYRFWLKDRLTAPA